VSAGGGAGPSLLKPCLPAGREGEGVVVLYFVQRKKPAVAASVARAGRVSGGWCIL
jgi:hypothetical protein